MTLSNKLILGLSLILGVFAAITGNWIAVGAWTVAFLQTLKIKS